VSSSISFFPIEDIIADAKAGRMFILMDDEDRENEGDLIIPAQMATAETINFMAKYGRGLICLAMTKERVDRLGLPLMGAKQRHAAPDGVYGFHRGERRGDDRHIGGGSRADD
jgi:3,4-dihydroxy-2-butanone 4-phosphate synthase